MDHNITYRQKDKGWQCIISYKVNGSWKQKSKQGFKSKKESKIAADKILIELKKSIKSQSEIIDLDYNLVTFEELSNKFIDHSRLYKENNTIVGYMSTSSNFKSLHNKKVSSIKKADIQSCIDIFVKKGLRSSSISVYIQRLKLFFSYYKENYNPNFVIDLDIKLPKSIVETNKKALNKSELDNLLSSLKDTEFYVTTLIASTCGLRLGEILGLTWADIDFINSTLDVNKQWKIDKNTNRASFGTLKSNNSYRVVPIPPSTLKELKRYKSTGIIDINNRICPFSSSQINLALNRKLKKLSNISIHELRHTYATVLISNGIDFKTVAKLLGHDVEQTLKTYSHVNDDMLKNATNAISKIF